MIPSAASAADACLRCGLPTAAGRPYCCVGCAWMGAAEAGAPPAGSLAARLALAAFLSLGTMVFSLALIGVDEHVVDEASRALQGLFRLGALALSLPVLFLLGVPLAGAVVEGRRWLTADALILLAVAAAWTLSAWNTFRGGGRVYFDTASLVLVLVSLGRWLDARAKIRAREALRVQTLDTAGPAHRLREGREEEVDLGALVPGDLLRVRAGEAAPVDGRVRVGRALLDTSALTGEETPRSVGPGDRVHAGDRPLDGPLEVEATAVGADRLRDLVVRRLEQARLDRPPLVRLADRISGMLLPVVLAVALGAGWGHGLEAGFEAGLLRSLAVLLIACPCALGLATPLAFQAALAAALRRGLLLRDGATLERLARVRRAFVDKTGTLTTGEPRLERVEPAAGWDREKALAWATALERGSDHPLARALRRAAPDAGELAVEAARVLPGVGVEGRIEGRLAKLARNPEGTGVRLSVDGEAAADLEFGAELRPGAREMIAGLRDRGLRPAMLTGDGSKPARTLGHELGIDVGAELLPHEKLEQVRDAGGRGVIFVGDGLNDAPSLAAADVGVVLEDASDLARSEADVHLVNGELGALPAAIDLARRAVRVARGNLLWAFAYNAVGVGLAATGRLTPVFAASAMVASSLLVVLRSARLQRS